MIIKELYYTTKNKTVCFKSPSVDDALQLCHLRYTTASETYFMARYPEEVQLDVEAMKTRIKQKLDDSQELHIAAYINNQIVGDLIISKISNNLKLQHRASLGISILKEYCNLGLGHKMIEIALHQAKLNGFEQVELGVFEDNDRAIHLYEKLGFKTIGKIPNAFKLKDGTYRDEILMVNFLKNV